ncbi:unnamed protein product [Gongylonema pulchrum]|uniref:Peptidase_M16_M domain-containing protein n=1 Tax=Gongylonema pulchrum TaxID=637853 RepID=A0A183EUM7_9BILA|nr:unnamed protein product [Gongylonema pulchrum]
MISLNWYSDKESPLNYVTQLSAELHRIPFEDVICVDYKTDIYKPELIEEVIEQMKPENMFCTIVSQSFAGNESNIKEKWYGTEYNYSKIEEDVLAKFSSAIDSVPDFLSLPVENEYIPSKFDLKPREETRLN